MSSAQGLNAEQQQAVESGNGPVLIVAGPGTGKTKTLSARIAHLLGQGVDASRILALTFTVKAAQEMAQRVSAQLHGGKSPTISTFHSLGYQVLRQLHPEAELTFVSEADRLAIIRELPRPTQLKPLTVRELALAISRAKGAISADPGGVLGVVLRRYQKALKARGSIDYDDLLYRSHLGFQALPEQCATWQRRYDYILIDEFQDTSELQWELIRAIRGNDNVFVIGDPKQSIYGFRGASAAMFDRFRQEFPDHREVTLRINYRSDQAIVALASAIFSGRDALVACSQVPGEVQAIKTLNELSEAEYVLARIEEGIGGSDLLKAGESKGRNFRDFAVIYRTHHVARAVQRRLHDSGIPFQVVGEGSPYEQPEIQAVIGGLRWFAEGAVPIVKGFTPGQVQVILEKIRPEQPVSKLAEAVSKAFDLGEDTAAAKRLGQLASTLVRFDNREDGLRICLEYIDQISQGDFYDPQVDAVTLLTIHASKGLEFPHVMLIAAEEGTLPNIRKTAPTDFEEEKRLFYVATTRAKHQLDIVWASKRRGEARQPSRFIGELGQEVLPRRDDPGLAQLHKKLHRREQKARQVTLF